MSDENRTTDSTKKRRAKRDARKAGAAAVSGPGPSMGEGSSVWHRITESPLILATLSLSAMLLTVILLWNTSLYSIPMGRNNGPDTYQVTADFTRVDRLMEGAEVRWGEQVIGRVSDLGTEGGLGRVTMNLDEGIDVPANVSATLEVPSALGAPFVRIRDREYDEQARLAGASGQPGILFHDPILELSSRPSKATGSLRDGAVIPESRTATGLDVAQQLAAMAELLNGSTIDKMRTSLDELSKAMDGRGEKVGTLTDDALAITGDMRANAGDFTTMIRSANELTRTLKESQGDMERLTKSATPVLESLAGQRDRMGRLVDQANYFSGLANAALQASGGDFGPPAENLLAIIEATDAFNGQVGPLLGSINSLVPAFVSSVKGDYLTFDGALLIPESIDQIITGGRGPEALLPGGGGIDPERPDRPGVPPRTGGFPPIDRILSGGLAIEPPGPDLSQQPPNQNGQ